MKRLPSKASITSAFLSIASAATLPAASLYFDQNGTEAGFGFANDGSGSYVWDTSSTVWNTASNGTGGTISAWSNPGDVAVFSGSGATNGYHVRLDSNITFNKVSFVNPITSGKTFLFDATSTRTMTVAPGGSFDVVLGDARNVVIGDNIGISGDFGLTGTGGFHLKGEGAVYSGTITMNMTGAGRLFYDNSSRYGTNTHIVLNSGEIRGATLGGSVTIRSLSGTGGMITGVAGKSTFIVNQATNTTFAGRIGSDNSAASTNALDFRKTGSGTLSLTGTAAHNINDNIYVDEGSLFVTGEIAKTIHSVIVAADANFGGTGISNKLVKLDDATSEFTAGMSDKAGTFILKNGLQATSGATLNFKLNGDDGSGGTLNSKISLTAGAWNVSGPVTVNLLDLGTGNFAAGNEYSVTLVESWADNLSITDWSVANLPEYWVLSSSPLAIYGNDIRVDFTVIPEASTYLMALAGGACLVWATRRSRSRQNAGA